MMTPFFENEILQLVIRLMAAALLGAAIGYEREFRGKGAGVRTHMLVAMGSCLFMLISKYGFADSDKFDAARVAAGVVTGIGFLGGGLIIKSKTNLITGLTTAAGLWVTSAIGMGAGSGMVLMAAICTALVLICMEILNLWSFKLGYRPVTVVFSSDDEKAIADVIGKLGKQVKHVFLSKKENRFQSEIMLRVPKKEKDLELVARLTSFPDVQLESLE